MNNKGNKHDLLTAELLRKYQDGRLSPDEAIRVETLRQQDPFVADALEGVSVASNGDSFAADVTTLRYRLQKRIRQRPGLSVYSARIAASVLILLVASYVVYQYAFPGQQQTAQLETTLTPPTAAAPPSIDSSLATLSARPPALLNDMQMTRKTKAPSALAQVLAVPDVSSFSIVDTAVADLTETSPSEKSTAVDKPLAYYYEAKDALATSPQRTTDRVRAEIARRTRTVSGQVLSAESNEPLPGVNVIVKGTTHGTVADTEGNYKLEVPQNAETLAFSFIGFVPKERNVLPGQRLNVLLEADERQLSEVVVQSFNNRKSYASTKTGAQPWQGMRSFRKYLRDHAQYPDDMPSDGEKTVKISFLVQADGSLTDFNVKRSAGSRLDEEAIRLIKEGPNWTPATLQSNPIAQKVVVKVRFGQ